jgi:hypothetical protein
MTTCPSLEDEAKRIRREEIERERRQKMKIVINGRSTRGYQNDPSSHPLSLCPVGAVVKARWDDIYLVVDDEISRKGRRVLIQLEKGKMYFPEGDPNMQILEAELRVNIP